MNDESNPYVTSDVQGLDQVNVKSLMSMDGCYWDMEIIQDLFNLRDQRCILKTQVGGGSMEDVVYWHEEGSGEYTVKSAYRLLQRRKGSWSLENNGSIWRRMWSIKAPPKVLNMVWRALSQCLPTRTVLQTKRVSVPVLYPVCDGGIETVEHVLITCPFAADCWKKMGRMCQVTGYNSFDSW